MTHRLLERWIAETLAESTVRTNSLLVTVFGDAIAPHGGCVWLGNLIDLLNPLGINARAVRTSVFRLAQEDWLQAFPIGRRSAYSLTTAGHRRIQNAYRRIYDSPQDYWNGEWQLVILPEGLLASKQREDLRRDLLWEGFGAIAPGVLARPAGNTEDLREVLRQTKSEDRVVSLQASSPGGLVSGSLQALVHQCWRLDQLADDYRRFSKRFGPTMKWLANDKKDITPAQSFALRILLIHEFRRIQLRDPHLPHSLLAKDWPGHTARALCREIYRKTLEGSEQHLLATLETPAGDLPPADESLYRRFGDTGSFDEEPKREHRSKAAPLPGAPARNRTRS